MLAAAQEKTPATVPTFESKVNLVLVPVVVRDRNGHAIGNLTRDDFRLLDSGKPQTISTFSAIRRTGEAQANSGDQPRQSQTTSAGSNAPPDRPRRYFSYIFDDLNIRFADMARVRAAALSHFQDNFQTPDLASIYTATGRLSLDFTADPDKLRDAVSKLRWGTVAGRGGMTCPDVSYYIADLVINKHDPLARSGLISHTAQCSHAPPLIVEQIALAAAEQRLMMGRQDTQLIFSTLRRAVRRLSTMPGKRIIVLASPGFFAQTPEARKAAAEILEFAASNEVIIDGLSVRGVIQAEEEEDVTGRQGFARRGPPRASAPDQLWIYYRKESANADGDVMKDLADGTGGAFFHNNNDLRLGFARLTDAPEFSYVLGFAPAELKTDGAFHTLKVQLANARGMSVEARRGYYAVAPDLTDAKTKAEIEDAVFSRENRNDIPVVLQLSYSKPKDTDVAKVMVAAKISATSLHDSLYVVVALFDADGAFVTQTAESTNLDLPTDAATAKDPAVTLRWELPGIAPGDYLVRLVLRESKGTATTTISRTLKVL
jgi:VWFA-related protein